MSRYIVKKPTGKTYSCKYAHEKIAGPTSVRVDRCKSYSSVFLDIRMKDDALETLSLAAVALTPKDARKLARDLKRSAKIAELN